MNTEHNNINISFIIPHKGREELLAQTLLSINNQDYDLKKVEVLVVTQNETLSPQTLPSQTELSINTLIRPASETISTLRNKGAEQATGQFLAFLDADIELSTNWITSMLDELNAEPDRVLVSAIQQCAATAPPLEQIRTALSNAHIDCNVRFLPGRNLFLNKSTFAAVGGFPEHLVTCEDYYFTDQVHSLGTLYYSSKATYIHLGEDKEYQAMFHKEIWRGQSNLQSIKGRPIPASEIPSFLTPIWILFFSILTIVCFITLQTTMAVSSLLLTLLPIALYSLRLHKIANGKIKMAKIIQFYLIYFPARIIGTITGLFKAISI
ncbi:MAG: glycosyltransferase family A protein [Spongiibacteraceae bacterium]